MPLPPDTTAAYVARRVVRGACCRVHHPGVLDEAELLTSEIVTDALRLGAPPMVLEVTCNAADGLVVGVRDAGTTPPVRKDGRMRRLAGRGTALLDAVSDAWGTDHTPGGTHVWFRLAAAGRPADPTAAVPEQRGPSGRSG